MKAIILAAWEGTRLKPITNTTPKPLIKIAWKSILEHNLENIYKYVSEIIIIVKYKSELIKEEIWKKYKQVKITYIEQWNEKWTGWALRWLNLDKDVLIINWDTIFSKKDLKNIIKDDSFWVLVKEVDKPENYWIFKVNKKNHIEEVIEKPKTYIWNLANLWIYKLKSSIFNYIELIELSPRWEYEITDAINLYVKEHKLKAIKSKDEFIDIWYPWDILKANNYFLNKLKKSKIKWTIEEWAIIKWNIILEKWAVIKSWTYIEWNVYIWKNTVIWPNAHLRGNNVILDDCAIWHTEIKECFIWNKTKAKHFWYIWSSVIWNNVNIAAWFISMDRRHDNTNIKFKIKWELIDTWSRKLWCIVWDNVRTWVNTLVYPWRIIENDSFTMPGDIIK